MSKPDCPSCMDLNGEDRKHDRDRGCFNCPRCGGEI